ncbi:unnamed protein product [Coregonus sp. 'balchen']|nr:unnamed protein product [Coregonus sp. 'balchen']
MASTSMASAAATGDKPSSSGSKKKIEKKLASKEESRFLSSIMGVMNNLRKQGTLCDVILVVQGKHIPAHRVVLAAASHFFSLMFTMNSSNVQSLLDAANQYQIEPVKKMCVDFLKEQVDATNCLGISALAECLDCPELKLSADDFIHQHFTEVYKLDEFLQLNVTQLTQLLHQDTLTVRAEDQIYESAVRWLKYDVCNRQSHMVEVLGCVRFPLVSKAFLSKTVQAEPLIQDNPDRPRRKKHDYRIALFGGSQPQSCRYFNPKRRDATAVFWDNVVYILGGSQLFPIKRMDCYNVLKDSWYSKLGSSALNLFECYDTRCESWQTKASMLMSRCSHGSVEANGLIYVCGGGVIYVLAGFQGVGRLGHILEYHTDTDRWVTCSKVRAFPVTSCLICVVDTCGAKEEETESTHTHTLPPSSSSSSSSTA